MTTAPDLVSRAHAALEVALPCALGAELLDVADPSAGVCFRVGGVGLTPFGTLHAAALAAVVELAGYLAVLPTLDEGEHAVTHAISTQYLRAAHEGEDVTVVGTLDKRARSLGFVTVVSTVESGPSARPGRIVARTQITKSVVRV